MQWRKIASLWRFELDAKRGPLETGSFGENHQRAGDKCLNPLKTGDFGENRQRVGNIQNVANITRMAVRAEIHTHYQNPSSTHLANNSSD